MKHHILEERMGNLNERLRILILQNARESSFYDERFLKEMRELADQILRLQKTLSGRQGRITHPFHSGAVVQF